MQGNVVHLLGVLAQGGFDELLEIGRSSLCAVGELAPAARIAFASERAAAGAATLVPSIRTRVPLRTPEANTP